MAGLHPGVLNLNECVLANHIGKEVNDTITFPRLDSVD